ncbi:hypothetical protein FOZ63_025448, partial [Perkinsus olseni]
MLLLILQLLVHRCGSAQSSDLSSASSGLRVITDWANSDRVLTLDEVAITLYTMRHISRCLLSKGEEATPLFWAWLRDFEDQAESIINAKDELFTLNVLTRQFRDDIKIFVEDFGETVLSPFSIAEGDRGDADGAKLVLPCCVDAPGVDVSECPAGVFFGRVVDAVAMQDRVESDYGIGIVVESEEDIHAV